MEPETEFLGLLVGKKGVLVNHAKKEVVRTYPKPKTLIELGNFIGILKFFRHFIRDFSAIASPLKKIFKKGKCIQKYNEVFDSSFDTLKEELITAPVLVPIDSKRSFDETLMHPKGKWMAHLPNWMWMGRIELLRIFTTSYPDPNIITPRIIESFWV